jgi:60 kDa SS-A/Ro ribonucleoprotein
MPKFNTKNKTTRVANRAGGKAFVMAEPIELTHAVLTSFLKDEFYESGNDRQDRITSLARSIAQKEPEFVAKLAKFARSEFHMRSTPVVLLAALAESHKGDDLVKRAIVACAERPDDLTELASLAGMPMPKQVKRGIRNAILKFSPYQLAKYKGEGKGVSLVDLFNLTHPKPKHATEEQRAAWEQLMRGELKSSDTWESDVSAGKTEADRRDAFSRLILENKMGYMALLRNLNNLIKYGVSDEVIARATAKLTDPEEVKRSKQLPFRFATAFQHVVGNRRLSDAISEAMDLAVDNVPAFDGRMLIAVDTSGSMSGDPIQKASVFAAALARANDADVVLYDTKVQALTVSGRSPVIDIARFIEKNAMGGGTDTGIVFDSANAKYDRVVILSDNESWAGGGNVQRSYETYKQRTGADPFVYAIDIQGYGTTDLMKSKRVFHLTGWSEKMLDFMTWAERGDSILDAIRSVDL